MSDGYNNERIDEIKAAVLKARSCGGSVGTGDTWRDRTVFVLQELDKTREALDGIYDMLCMFEKDATFRKMAREDFEHPTSCDLIARCIQDAKWRKEPEFTECYESYRGSIEDMRRKLVEQSVELDRLKKLEMSVGCQLFTGKNALGQPYEVRGNGAAISYIVDKLEELEDLHARGVVCDRDCTCGSGGHPRHCAKHPHAFDMHIQDIERECLLEDTKQQLHDLEIEYTKLLNEVELMKGDILESNPPSLEDATQRALAELKSMTVEQLKQTLVRSGIINDDGTLTEQYKVSTCPLTIGQKVLVRKNDGVWELGWVSRITPSYSLRKVHATDTTDSWYVDIQLHGSSEKYVKLYLPTEMHRVMKE